MNTGDITLLGMLPLLVRPFPDESLNGFLTRVAHRNARSSAVEILLTAGGSARQLSELHRLGKGEEEVAALYRVRVEEIRIRRHASLGGVHEPIRLAAGVIGPHLVRTNRPRVPPHTCARIGYHRYEWDFEFLPFDPETGEYLIDCCPHCSEGLSWARPGFLTCISCGRRLAQAGERCVDEDTGRVGRFFADLLSLDERRRRAARSKLAPKVRNLPTEALFRFLFEISGLFEFKKHTKRERPTELNWPSILIRAYQIATEWPEALLEQLKEIRLNASERGGRYGLRKEFGDVGIVLREWEGIAEIKAVVFPVIREFLNLHPEIALKAKSRIAQAILPENRYATLKEIQHQFGWGHLKANRLLKLPGVVVGGAAGSGAPLQIDRQKVAEIYDDLETMISRRTIRAVWGLQHDAIVQIADAGIFVEVDEPHVALVGNVDGLFRRPQIADVFDRAYACEPDEGYEGATISFDRVVSELGKEVATPWPVLLQAVLAGRLRPVKISQKEKGGFGRIRFRQDDAHRWISAQIGQGEGTLSLLEVAKRLRVHMDVVYLLVEKGLLKVIKPRAGERGRRVSMERIAEFEVEYVSSAFLSAKFDTRSDFMIKSLDLQGVKPIPALPAVRRIYRWSDIPKDFKVLSRAEMNEMRKELGLPTKLHPMCKYPTQRL
jgi:hypothetical protein